MQALRNTWKLSAGATLLGVSSAVAFSRYHGDNKHIVINASGIDPKERKLEIKRYRLINNSTITATVTAKDASVSQSSYLSSYLPSMSWFGLSQKKPEENAKTERETRDLVQLRSYTAEWCGPCRRIKPHLAELEKEGKIELIHAKEIPLTENRRKGLIIPCFDVIKVTGENVDGADVDDSNIEILHSLQTSKSEDLNKFLDHAKELKANHSA